MKAFSLIFLALVSSSVMAKGLEPQSVETDGLSSSARFDYSHHQQDCGLLVKWGDGSEEKIRVGRDVNENDFTVSHNYKKPGSYIFTVTGKTIIRGFGSLFACQGDDYQTVINAE